MGGRRPRPKNALTAAVTIPAAILIGSAIIGGGLYFGLRARPTPAPSASTSSAPAPSVRAPLPSLSTPERVPVTLPPGELDKRVRAALEAHRPALVSRCWEPTVAARPGPPVARFTFNYTFAPDGTQLGRGVAEDRATGRPELTACVLRELPALKIAPIGRQMSTKITFELP